MTTPAFTPPELSPDTPRVYTSLPRTNNVLQYWPTAVEAYCHVWPLSVLRWIVPFLGHPSVPDPK